MDVDFLKEDVSGVHYTGKLRWYVRMNQHGLRSEPILQQEVAYASYGLEPETMWEDVETVTEKV